jgi:septum formation protein
MDKLILASASPRRQEILKQMGLVFSVQPQDVDESFSGLSADAEASRLAKKKVSACLEKDQWILGADTFIVYKDRFIGKPENRSDAHDMLNKLSGKTHSVITGLALCIPSGEIETAVCRTEVKFSVMSSAEIEWYLEQNEWQGAAAAYRIQQKGAMFIESISGSYSNVMGLPINTFYGMLSSNNYNFRT